MRLRRGLWLLAGLAWAAAPAAAAKRIVILRSGSFPPYDFAVRGFQQTLSARGVAFSAEDRTLPKDEKDIDAAVAAIRADPPDLVFTVGTLAAKVMAEKGGGTPFVYCMVVDPPSLGLGGGGAVMEIPPAIQLSLIKEYFPGMKRVGVIHSGQRNRDVVRLLRDGRQTDPSLVMVQADTPVEMSDAVQRLSRQADCLLMLSDGVLYSPQTATQVILQTLQSGLPLIAISPSFVRAGAVAGIYPDYKDNGALAAEAVARFFNGEALSSIPVQWPTRALLAVNLIVAKRLGVSVPQKTIAAAAEVIQ